MFNKSVDNTSQPTPSPIKPKLTSDWNSRVKERSAMVEQLTMELREDLMLAVLAAPGIVVKLPYDIMTDNTPKHIDEARKVIEKMSVAQVIAVLRQLIELREA